MRVKTFYRMLRYISAVVLFFFLWTFGPMWQAVAYAATPQKAKSSGNSPRNKAIAMPRSENSAEQFEKALDNIRQKLKKAEDKSHAGVEPTPELEAIKARLSEIEATDAELQAEFSATEKKLKDAKLPKEILKRHYAFVKNYQDNLKELVANLTGIERSAGSRGDLDKALKKAREHLERVKAPSHHQKLDPNNLPFRARKAMKARAPRLKKEDFEKDFPPQRSPRTAKNLKSNDYLSQSTQSSRRTANGQIQDTGFTFNDVFKPASWIMHRASVRNPILVASNGPLTGLLSSDPGPEIPDLPFSEPALSKAEGPSVANEGTQNLESLSAMSDEPGTMLLAQADPPTSDDLAETPDIQFTDAIRAKAQELGGNPVKIYNWVRNNIEYAPTYGSIQGADQCLESKICNDMDTASLLIALLRVSGVYAHYVYGTVDIPSDKAMNWVGGVTDPKMAGTIFATNGVPVTALISGGTIKYDRIEHVWVKAYLDYIPSRGAVQRQGNTWIPLDASYKQYNYTQGIDMASAVPFDAQSFANQLQSTATINPDGSVTNVNSAYVRQVMTNYQTQVQNYIQQNYPNATVGDVVGKKEIIQQNYPILLGTLPYKTLQVGSEFATVPDNLRETMSFSIPVLTGTSAGLTYTTGMPQIAGKKITLSFSPATAADQTIIDSFLSSEEPISLPAYLINLKPDLSLDGLIVATGTAIAMGEALSWTISLNEPGIGASNINNKIVSGQYLAIGLDTARIGSGQLNTLKMKVLSTKSSLEAGNYISLTKDDLVGDVLYSTIISYFTELDAADEMIARSKDIIRYRVPSIGMFSIVLDSSTVFGVPFSTSQKGMMMDVDRIMQTVYSKSGLIDDVKQYMFASGSNSSALENSVPEQLYSTSTVPVNGISAVSALKMANDQGIPLYSISQANMGSLVPQLQVGENVKNDIINAVNAGKIVTVSRSNIIANNWSGCGYIIIDPTTGAGAYLIAGGFSGALIQAFFSSITDLIVSMSKKGYIKSSGTINFVGKLAAAATVISFCLSMYNIVTNPNLTLEQKISDIVVWTAATCGALWVGGIIAVSLNPFFAIVAITAVYLLFTSIALELSFSD